jgi:hypothetical protein
MLALSFFNAPPLELGSAPVSEMHGLNNGFDVVSFDEVTHHIYAVVHRRLASVFLQFLAGLVEIALRHYWSGGVFCRHGVSCVRRKVLQHGNCLQRGTSYSCKRTADSRARSDS